MAELASVVVWNQDGLCHQACLQVHAGFARTLFDWDTLLMLSEIRFLIGKMGPIVTTP